jgi:hypothetical protein
MATPGQGRIERRLRAILARGMEPREFIALLGSAAAWPLAVHVQQARPVRRVGVLMGIADDAEAKARIAAFLQALQQLGWKDGRNGQTRLCRESRQARRQHHGLYSFRVHVWRKWLEVLKEIAPFGRPYAAGGACHETANS